MQLQTLLTELGSLGVILRIENGSLRVKAQPGILTDPLKVAIAEHKAALISRLETESPPIDHWRQLAASSLTDRGVIALDDAVFLFAYRLIQNADRAELAGIWKQYSPYWKKRQPRDAYDVVEQFYESRSKRESGARR